MPEGLLGNIILGLLINWGADAGQDGFGYILNAIEGGEASSLDYASLQQELTTIESQIGVIQTEVVSVLNLLQDVIAAGDWNNISEMLTPVEDNVESMYELFISLKPGYTDDISTIINWTQTNAVNDLHLLNSLVTSNQAESLLGSSALLLAAKKLVTQFSTSPQRGSLTTLASNVSTLRGFFLGVVVAQTKILTLYVNWAQ